MTTKGTPDSTTFTPAVSGSPLATFYSDADFAGKPPDELVQLAVKLIKAGRFEESVRCLNPAVEAGNDKAQYYLGVRLLRGEGVKKKDVKRGVSLIQSSSKQGFVPAIYEEGVCLLNGEGIDRNRKEAIQKLLQAAEKGHKEAQFLSAFCLKTSFKEGPEKTLAFENFQKAADRGQRDAQLFTARCLKKGFGVEMSPSLSKEYYEKAASKGVFYAQLYLADERHPTIGRRKAMPYFFDKNQRDERFGWSYPKLIEGFANEKEAFLFYQERASAPKPEPEHCFRRGLCYAMGIGVEKSLDRAFQDFSKAKSTPGSQLYLGIFFANGFGTERSEMQASKYLFYASKSLPAAQFYMGLGCFSRFLCDLKQEQSIDFFTKATKEGFSLAQHNLAICLYYGIGVTQNQEKAEAFLKSAATLGCRESQEFLKQLEEKKAALQPVEPKVSEPPKEEKATPPQPEKTPVAQELPKEEKKEASVEITPEPSKEEHQEGGKAGQTVTDSATIPAAEEKIKQTPQQKETLTEQEPLIQRDEKKSSGCCTIL